MLIKQFTKVALLVSVLLNAPLLAAETEPRALYLANEGVLITHDKVKVLFDPLFESSFNVYQLLPTEMEQDLFAGLPPFDNVDAVFVSHYHGDHFSPELMLSFLKAQGDIALYAPTQAVSALHEVADVEDQAIFQRVTGLALEYGDEPITISIENLLIEAVRIPHSGWPARRLDVENISFRVTLGDDVSVLHMGDADTSPEHFSMHPGYWENHEPDLALPPYWFFSSERGSTVLAEIIKPGHAIGIHVPLAVPNEVKDFDLFTEPGESRAISTIN